MNDRTEIVANDVDRILAANALAQKFVTEEQLHAVLNDFTLEPGNSLADFLVRRQLLTPDERRSFETMVTERLSAAGKSVSARELAERAASKILPNIHSAPVRRFLESGILSAAQPNAEANRRSEATTVYEMLEISGVGGLGEVWRTQDANLDRTLAVKRMKHWTPGSDKQIARFLREAHVTAQLQHPNIVPVHQVWRDPRTGEPMFSMDFISGRTFEEVIRDYHAASALNEPGGMTLNRLVTMFVEVCRTVSFAHSQGVVHRDLKPANVMVGAYGELFLLDWGLAKKQNVAEESAEGKSDDSTDYKATSAGEVLGSPYYMAPEQAIGDSEAIDARTDVFGLGAILFQILTNHPPHDLESAKSMTAMREAIQRGPARTVLSLNPKAPRALTAICQKAIAVRPEDRYPNVALLVRDLEHWLAREPVSALPETRMRRVARWMVQRRRWTTFVGVALSLLVLGIGGVAAMVLVHQRMVYELEQDTILDSFRWARSKLDTELDDQLQTAKSLAQAPTSTKYLKATTGDPAKLAEARDELAATLKVFYNSFPEYRRIALFAANLSEAKIRRLTRIRNVDQETIVEGSGWVQLPSGTPEQEYLSVLKAESSFIGDVQSSDTALERSPGQHRLIRCTSVALSDNDSMSLLSIDRECGVYSLPHADDQVAVVYDHAGKPLAFEQYSNLLSHQLVQDMLHRVHDIDEDDIVTIPMPNNMLFCGAKMLLRPGAPEKYLLVASIIDLSVHLKLPITERFRWIGATFFLLMAFAGFSYWIGFTVVRIAQGQD